MAALGIQSMFMPTSYGGASTKWVKHTTDNETLLELPALKIQSLIKLPFSSFACHTHCAGSKFLASLYVAKQNLRTSQLSFSLAIKKSA